MVANPVPPDTLMGCLCTWASSYAGTCLNYNRCTPTNSAFLMLEQWTSSLQRRSIFFSYGQSAQKWKFTAPSWLGRARWRGAPP
jgi:hypothetical protein